MYKIGELSRLCSISVKTLRFYDTQGLLVPDDIDRFTGYRYYSAAKLADCYRIIALKELGFSLDEIKNQLRADGNDEIIASLEAKAAELNKAIENAERQLKRIDAMKHNLTEGEKKMFDIIVKSTDSIRVAFTREFYRDKSEALNEADRIAAVLPKTAVGKRKIVINYETEYREDELDLAACVEISGAVPKTAEYAVKDISFGYTTASLICQKSELDEAYQALLRHFDEANLKVCGAYYEIYHEDDTVELKVPVCERTAHNLHTGEKFDIPFEDDPEVCGKWVLLDIVPTREHFIYGKPKCSHSAWLNELYFIDGGKPYWAVHGWTKGYLLTSGPERDPIVSKYTIEITDGHKLMFLEMNDYCDGSALGFGEPEIWVYEKAEDKHYASREDFGLRDKIDYPFETDPSVIGKWNVCDLVHKTEEFDPQKQSFPESELYLLSAEFKDGGVYVSTSKNGTNSVTFTWTKGLILHKREQTACAYEIKLIDGKEYLFRQWKSGDYVYGGGRVYYYVFTRA